MAKRNSRVANVINLEEEEEMLPISVTQKIIKSGCRTKKPNRYGSMQRIKNLIGKPKCIACRDDQCLYGCLGEKSLSIFACSINEHPQQFFCSWAMTK